jgi:hypothetical protein
MHDRAGFRDPGTDERLAKTRPFPSTLSARATFSTPFCNDSTRVRSSTMGASASAAACVSCDLVVITARSGGGGVGRAAALTL